MRTKLLAIGIVLIALTACTDESRSPVSVIDDFHQSLKKRDSALALSVLARDVVVFESGRSDPGRDDYAVSHLALDLKLATQAEWTLVNRRFGGSDKESWVLSAYQVKGRVDGVPVNRVYLETAIVRNIGGMNRIIHLHWSSTPNMPG